MSLDQDFQEASQKVKSLSKRPSNEELLQLYALYKQATDGDITGERPGGFDFKGIAKYDAWKNLAGTSSEEAKKGYVELVDELMRKDG